jgi:RNA polymerase sigma-70 factor (ECF subfamily)
MIRCEPEGVIVLPDAGAPDDYAIMDAIAAGDSTAMRTLYDRHSGLVFAMCLRMLAEELLSEIFWELWDRRDRYDANRASPLTYLLTLTRSRGIDRQRARRSRPVMASLDSGEPARGVGNPSAPVDPLKQTIAGEHSALVRGALSRLEPQQRQAIECAYFDGLSHSEIAEKLNKPLGTIKTYIRQGLIRLREAVRTTSRERSETGDQ